jgi:hypothetical protein
VKESFLNKDGTERKLEAAVVSYGRSGPPSTAAAHVRGTHIDTASHVPEFMHSQMVVPFTVP